MDITPKTGKRSTWLVVNRCLDLLMRLMTGPASSGELLEIVRTRAVEDGDPTGEEAIAKRFEEDRRRLREWLGEISYDRTRDEYELLELKRPLLDLSPQAVRGIAFLQETFGSQGVPMRTEVNALLDQIMMILSYQRRRAVQNERGILELELRAKDNDIISDEIREVVERACAESRELQFKYVSPKRADSKIILHRVEPMRTFFDSVRCHYYLEAFSLESWGAKHFEPRRVITYRMGRMSDVTLLPTHFPRGGRRIPTHDLVYELTPEIARLGVTEHFPGSQILMRSDDSALVRALSVNLFFDLRTLLHYGANCRVIGGDEAVGEMRRIVKAMYEGYFPAENGNSNQS